MKKRIILSSALGTMMGIGIGAVGMGKVIFRRSKQESDLAQKHLVLYLMMNKWVHVKQENKSIAAYLEKKGYREVAIYGMNYVGETLFRELSGSNIRVSYGIDRNAGSLGSALNIVSPDDALGKTDAVIVTPVTFYGEICEMLADKVNCPILSIEDILYEL